MTQIQKELGMLSNFLRPKEAGRYMGVGIATVWKLARDGKLTKIKLSTKVTLFDRREIDKLMIDSRVLEVQKA
jgi:excisionase family DNA binding protein